MTVLQEIVSWSKDRPLWQRDALRRLVEQDELTEADIRSLVDICKSAYGLSDPQESVALETNHLPNANAAQEAVTLESIFHHRGVNALAESQTVKLAPHLTIVYGDNGAGKTGYIRILKSACRARGRELILGNVVSGVAPPTPAVAIMYRVGSELAPREWSGEGEDDFIARVSVFDTRSASVYLTEKTDVAFRPFGLDLFDKLVQACKAVRLRLEAEQRTLGASMTDALLPLLPEGTAASKLLRNVTSLTKPEAVMALATLSDAEQQRLAVVEKSLVDLQANDPTKLTLQLRLRTSRARSVADHIERVELALSADAVTATFGSRSNWREKTEAARRLRDATFPATLLAGTGSDAWKALWEAARSFSEGSAYTGQSYPVAGQGAQCVLCQQGLTADAAHRLEQFETFIGSAIERDLRQALDAFELKRKSLAELIVRPEAATEALKELRLEYEEAADAIDAALTTNESRQKALAHALVTGTDPAPDCPVLASVRQNAVDLANQLEQRVSTLSGDKSAEVRKRLSSEAQELRARVLLSKHQSAILGEIERKKRIAAFDQCIGDTKTYTITQKSSTLTRSTVTQKLKDSLQTELGQLDFRHVEVELREVGGAEGVLYHRLVLARAPGVDLPRVISEGEQRCLSIAAFFAELSTADDPSGIVFDDPVSSLDYRWRESVARRLVEEAKRRQVIVFTHDVVFLLWLKQFAAEQEVSQLDQHVRQLSSGAGVCAEELPWVAMPVKQKIGYLKNEWHGLDKLLRAGHQAAYEKEAKYLYGMLREAWERALEEVLLCKVVERFRPGVQTQQITKLADITEEDCRTLEAAMKKCSRWLPGHDQAAAARAPVPTAESLKTDIEALEQWVESINKRRR